MFPISKFSLEKARRLQMLLAEKVIRTDCLPKPIRHVAGVDVAYTASESIGVVAVFDYDSQRPIEYATSRQPTRFPYIPTLLAFREVPPAVSAISNLKTKPDVLLIDGHGIAHPNRFGFASHLGLVLDMPTVGVAKNLLCGRVTDAEDQRWKPIVHGDEIVGGAVVTRQNVKPVYVSVGHKVSLETSINIVLHCAQKHRIPEPIREAHQKAEGIKRGIEGNKSVKKQV